MGNQKYVPDAGEIVWLQFDPQAGSEQAGHRPALVLSPAAYNSKTHLMICCPITSKRKGYPFEVFLELEGQYGVVLADQVKSLDWVARKAVKKGRVPDDVLEEVRGKLKALLAM